MIKIPTLFRRGDDHRVIPEITEGCEWVVTGAGMMTIKIDGQNVKVENGKVYRRLKPAQGEYDEASYIPCNADDPADQYIIEAFVLANNPNPGIYEVFGPKINGNPHGVDKHRMVQIVPVSGTLIIPQFKTIVERNHKTYVVDLYLNIKKELEDSPEIEGFVFQFEQPNMKLDKAAKIKRKDYGLPWPVKGDTMGDSASEALTVTTPRV